MRVGILSAVLKTAVDIPSPECEARRGGRLGGDADRRNSAPFSAVPPQMSVQQQLRPR